MTTDVYTLDQATGPTVRAEALVSSEPFSARYDLDRVNGIISREGHPLKGSSITNKIFIAPGVQGGVAGGWALLSMAKKTVGFAGLVLGDTNPVMVQGAVTAGIPIAAGFNETLLSTIQTGDIIEINPADRTLRIIERAQ